MQPSPLDLRVLHGLRLKGFVDTAPLARSLGLPAVAVQRQLETAATDGHVQRRTGNRVGWSLTTEGRKEGERMVADELDAHHLRAHVDRAYRRFVALNQPFLDLCTRWQVVDPTRGVLNDHRDAAYDAALVAELAAIDRAVQPICGDLAAHLDRFAHYGPRLAEALRRIQAGDSAWFTKPTIESYHTLWFELHEDLLVTLGLDRVSEQS